MRIIGVFLATVFYLIGITILSIIPMFVFGGKYLVGEGGLFILLIPAIIAILFAIALSMSDSFLHWVSGFREPLQKEQERLQKSGVYDVLKESGAVIDHVLVADEDGINAYAIGGKTVVFTLGILDDSISNEILRGIAAHEAGHIHAGDTKINRMFYAFSRIGVFMEGVSKIMSNIYGYFGRMMATFMALGSRMYAIIFIPLIMMIIFKIFHFIPTVLIWMSNFIMFSVSRTMEFAADKYAHDLNYGEGLKSFLYVILEEGKKNNSQAQGGVSALLNTHPSPGQRLQALEKLDDEKSNRR